MAREVDEVWIEEAVERYRRIDNLLAEFHEAAKKIEVTVQSPDGLVQVVVTASGDIQDVRISAAGTSRGPAQLSRSVKDAVVAAHDAADWARKKLHADLFGDYQALT
jgi:DNA-binding protein YbaB